MAFSLNDFSNIKKIGEGGMGHVYSATQISLDRKVVIKELASNLDKDPNIIKKFGNEARSAAALDHENIIHIYDFGEDRGSFFISMEFIDGMDLEQFLRWQPFSFEVGLMVLLEAAKGLRYAHERDIVHCDVKPGNILISKIGKVKVADFGLAQAGNRKIEIGDSTSVFITPGYMPPEIASGMQNHDKTVDIWSIGVLAYRIITGSLPFTATTMAKLVNAIVNEKEKDLEQMVPSLPNDLCEAIKHCLVKDPQKRAQTLDAFIGSLENFIFEMGVRDIDRMIMAYLSNKENAMQMLAELLVQFHMHKGNDFQDEGNIYKADAHFRQAEKYGVFDPHLRPHQPVVLGGKNVPGSLSKPNRFAFLKMPRPKLFPMKKSAGIVSALSIVAVGVLSMIFFSGRGPDKKEEKARLLRNDAQTVFEINSDRGISSPANNAKPKDTAIGASETYDVLKQGLTKVDGLDKAEKTNKKTAVSRAKPAVERQIKPLVSSLGFVKFKIDPPQASVMVDGKRCSPLEISQGKQLNPGGHSIAVYSIGYAAYSSTLMLESGETQILNVTLKQQQRGIGNLHVYSYPWAEVYIDDSYQGNAPTPKPLSLPEGDHSLVLKRAGFKTYNATVHVAANETTRIKVQLEQ